MERLERVELSRRAYGNYQTLPPEWRLVVKNALHRLRAGPRRKGRKVRGQVYAMVVRAPGGRRHYRLVYEVIESERLILVCKIGALFL